MNEEQIRQLIADILSRTKVKHWNGQENQRELNTVERELCLTIDTDVFLKIRLNGELYEFPDLDKIQQLINQVAVDVKVKVSENDTTAGYLEDKISEGQDIQIEKLNAGNNEVLQISYIGTISNAGSGNGLVLPKVLSDTKIKSIVAGNNVSILNGPDTLTINASITSAGLLTQVYLTFDVVNVGGNPYYRLSDTGKGTASGSQQIIVDDNQTLFFGQDFISSPYDFSGKIKNGTYVSKLTCSTNSNSNPKRFKIEVYVCDVNGNPRNSGITGQPTGDLGSQVVAVMDSGIINLEQNNITSIELSAFLNEDLIYSAGERIRFHISGQKVGIVGNTIQLNLFTGLNYNSYVEIPVTIVTGDVVDESNINPTGSLTDTLNIIDTDISNLENTVSNLTNIHNDLTGLQGGAVGERYHVSLEEKNRIGVIKDTFFLIRNKTDLLFALNYSSDSKVAVYVGGNTIQLGNETIPTYGNSLRLLCSYINFQIIGDVNFTGSGFRRLLIDGICEFTSNDATVKTITTNNQEFWTSRISAKSSLYATAIKWVTGGTGTDSLRFEDIANSDTPEQNQFEPSGNQFFRNMWKSPNYVKVVAGTNVTVTETLVQAGSDEATTRQITIDANIPQGDSGVTKVDNFADLKTELENATEKDIFVSNYIQEATSQTITLGANKRIYGAIVEIIGNLVINGPSYSLDIFNELIIANDFQGNADIRVERLPSNSSYSGTGIMVYSRMVGTGVITGATQSNWFNSYTPTAQTGSGIAPYKETFPLIQTNTDITGTDIGANEVVATEMSLVVPTKFNKAKIYYTSSAGIGNLIVSIYEATNSGGSLQLTSRVSFTITSATYGYNEANANVSYELDPDKRWFIGVKKVTLNSNIAGFNLASSIRNPNNLAPNGYSLSLVNFTPSSGLNPDSPLVAQSYSRTKFPHIILE